MDTGASMGWANIDARDDAHWYVDALAKWRKDPRHQSYKPFTHALVGAAPGRRILDVGCGLGEDVLAMARLVGEGGMVVGVDASQTMIQEARRLSEGSMFPVRFEAAEAAFLPFGADSFDGCRADRVFQHLTNAEAALFEMVRVTKPGGMVVLADPDYGSAVLDFPDRELVRTVQTFLTETLANPWSGRRLPALLRRAGLLDIQVHVEFWPFSLEEFQETYHIGDVLGMMSDAGIVTGDQVSGILEELSRREAEGTFFGGLSFFVASGRKPSSVPDGGKA